MSVLGVAEVASELSVSPRRVRQMLADGVLSGERIGRSWIVESDHLRQVERHRKQAGRPWSPASAWALLALADGRELGISHVERSRARKRLSEGLGVVAGKLGARASFRQFYAHPSVLSRLAGAPAVVPGGISAVAEHGGGLVSGDEFEGYVRAKDLGSLVSEYGLDDKASRPNVVLRVVEDSVWPFDSGVSSAWSALVAVDLLESGDQRARRAGLELISSL